MTRAAAGVAAVAGLAIVAAWLRVAPGWVGGLVASMGPAAGEALFNLLIFAPMLALGVIGAWLGGGAIWPPGDKGRSVRTGLLCGGGGLALAIAYAATAGVLHRGQSGGIGAVWLLGIVTIAVQVVAEEAVFRGWLQPVAQRWLGSGIAVPLVALIFAGLHSWVQGGHLIALGNMALGGVLFGLLAWRERGISGAVAAHLAWNAGEQLVLGLDPNPGIGGFGAILDLELAGAPLWSGGEAGLNASLAMSFALVTVLLALSAAMRGFSGRSPTSAAGPMPVSAHHSSRRPG